MRGPAGQEVSASSADGAAMGARVENAYTPNEDAARVYDELYAEYSTLHDYFGRGTNEVMSRLKALRRRQVATRTGAAPEGAES